MMNLVMVTFEPDYTQFLVDANTYNLNCGYDHVRDEAIALAIEAHIEYQNKEFGGFNDEIILEEVLEKRNYSVADIDMEILLEIIKRNDWYPCLYGKAVVFSG